MKINFYPCRDRMFKEIEHCTVLKRIDTLLSFCNSCVYRVGENVEAHRECLTCKVRQGMNRTLNNRKRKPVEDEELLGVC